MSDLKGIDREAVTAWLEQHLAGSKAPYTFELIAAGGSNLTYRLTDAAGTVFVLRRPPVRGVVATAHDMSREWRIMDALHKNTDVPVPATLAYCRDVEVTGAEFYVMDFVDGLILRDQNGTQGLSKAQALVATESLVDVQVAFHSLDIDGVGLDDQHYYFAFGWWKMACIVEGVYARLQKGASGGMKTAPVDQVGAMVVAYLEEARRYLHT